MGRTEEKLRSFESSWEEEEEEEEDEEEMTVKDAEEASFGWFRVSLVSEGPNFHRFRSVLHTIVSLLSSSFAKLVVVYRGFSVCLRRIKLSFRIGVDIIVLL